MATLGRTGSYANRDRPPPKLFLGIGAVCLGLNHLSVVLGAGLQAEALMIGCWLVLFGGWVQFAGRSFDAVWTCANPRGWRVIGLLLSFVVALAVADAVAWFGYGQHLLG